MLDSILALNGVKELTKKQQKMVVGGGLNCASHECVWGGRCVLAPCPDHQ